MSPTNAPPDAVRHLAVDQPIINSPFAEPSRHFYFDDIQVGDSTTRFLDSVTGLVGLRDQLLHAKLHGDAITA